MWLYCGNLLSGCPIVVKWYFSKFFPAVLAAHHIIFSHFSPKQSSPFCVIYAKSNLQVGDPSESMEKNDLELYFQKKKKNIHVYTAVKSGDKIV